MMGCNYGQRLNVASPPYRVPRKLFPQKSDIFISRATKNSRFQEAQV